MNLVFRPAKQKDLDDIYDLALNAGFGMTTLCKDKDELSKRIALSEESFSKQLKRPLCENYLFVLEDADKQKVIGTAAVESALGYHQPWYAYRQSKVTKVCLDLDIHVVHDVLVLTNDMHGFSELGTLYLHPDYRRDGIGVFLSRARFLFIASFMHRFADYVVAEMRGVSDEHGISPFWESLGRHFFKMPFVKADELSGRAQKQFIADLLPHNPIYTALLSKKAQCVIGKPHPSTKPAMKILEREGFQHSHYVDIFDAGPTIKARTKEIKTIKNSKVLTLHVSDEDSGERYLVSNESLDFRCVFTTAKAEKDGLLLNEKVRARLGLQQGEKVRAVKFSDRKRG